MIALTCSAPETRAWEGKKPSMGSETRKSRQNWGICQLCEKKRRAVIRWEKEIKHGSSGGEERL